MKRPCLVAQRRRATVQSRTRSSGSLRRRIHNGQPAGAGQQLLAAVHQADLERITAGADLEIVEADRVRSGRLPARKAVVSSASVVSERGCRLKDRRR